MSGLPRGGSRLEVGSVWRGLSSLMPPKTRRAVALLAIEALLAGLLEAAILVLVVSTALAVSEGTDTITMTASWVGDLELSSGRALALAGGAGVVMLGLHIHIARVTARLSAAVIRTARHRAITSFAGATWARQAQDREGALQETVSTLSGQSAALVVHFSSFLSASIGLAALLLAALFVNPVITAVVLVFGTTIFLVLRPVARLTQRRAGHFVAINSNFTEGMSQWSTLAMEFRVFGVEDVEVGRLAENNRSTASALERTRFVSRIGSDLYKDLAVLFLIGAVAGLFVVTDVDLAAVGAVVLLIVRSLSYAQQTNSSLQLLNEASPNLHSLLDRLQSLEEAAEPVGSRPLAAIHGVRFQDVDYDYEPGRAGVRGLSFDLAAGEAVGVIGPSGGGKSTLVQVLLRLRPPTRGAVVVSGIPYQEVEPESWHRLVTLVPQEPKLFQGSVADNIAFLRPGITRAQVEHAAALAHVIDDIQALSAGFDTELGPRGAGLSGGQKQRIAIARALVGEPQLLVLDEPTSALDVRSEQLLQETILDLKGKVTLLIVAHRLTTLACCDRVIAMADGRIRTIGTLEEAIDEVSFDEDAALHRGDGSLGVLG